MRGRLRATRVLRPSHQFSSPEADGWRCPASETPCYNLIMKQIVTVVRPHLAENVIGSLRRAPIEAISVTEVKGYGRQKSYLDEYQETEYSQAFVPKVEITLWVDDSRCEEILEKITSIARSGRIGDGKIFVMPVTHFL